MTLKEYQQATMRTLPNLGSTRQNIDHMIYGMFSEYNELIEATDDVNRAEELTDILWYFSNYCNITGIDLAALNDFVYPQFFIRNNREVVTRLFIYISKLTDIEKKELAYGKKVDENKRLLLVNDIFKSLNDAYADFGIDPNESMQRNIDKLKARYPMNFTDDYTGWQAFALNRDLDKERAILEGSYTEQLKQILNFSDKEIAKIVNGNSNPEMK
jgi:NTP pyrophosphatase (non-canonical NTP hydrolase)